MDAPNYVADFKGADPVWNVTGSGGTNANCLAAYPASESWKCLLAPFILPHIQADIYVMNSAYDAWQIGNNKPGCVSTKSKPCDDSGVQVSTRILVGARRLSYRSLFLRAPRMALSQILVLICPRPLPGIRHSTEGQGARGARG